MNCYTFRLHLPTGDIDKDIVTTSLHEAWQLLTMPEATFMENCLGAYLKDEYQMGLEEEKKKSIEEQMKIYQEIREYYEGGRGMGTL